MEEKSEKKEICSSTAVKGLINGFVSYGIILFFIFLFISILILWMMNNSKGNFNHDFLKYSIPIIISIFVFFLTRVTCHLSTFDLFKKCKIKEEDIEKTSTKINLFYLCFVVFSVLVILTFLLTKFTNEQKTILIQSNNNYKNYSTEYAEYEENEMFKKFEIERNNVLLEVLIVEAGLISGIFSLIPTQKKLIIKYNK